MVDKKPAADQTPLENNSQPTEDEIRIRAYEIYSARNGDPGSEVGNWLKAEAELRDRRATALQR